MGGTVIVTVSGPVYSLIYFISEPTSINKSLSFFKNPKNLTLDNQGD